MGLLSLWTSRSIAACSAVFATQLSRAAGLPSAVAGTVPLLTGKYPKPRSEAIVKMTPRMKLAINLIYILSRCKLAFCQVINSVLSQRETLLIMDSKSRGSAIGYWLLAIGYLLFGLF